MWLGLSSPSRHVPVVSTGSFALDTALGTGGLPKVSVLFHENSWNLTFFSLIQFSLSNANYLGCWEFFKKGFGWFAGFVSYVVFSPFPFSDCALIIDLILSFSATVIFSFQSPKLETSLLKLNIMLHISLIYV